MATGLQKRLQLLSSDVFCASRAEDCEEGKQFVDVSTLKKIAALVPCVECAGTCSCKLLGSSPQAPLQVVCDDCGYVVFSKEPIQIRGIDNTASKFTEGILRLVCNTLLSGRGYAGYTSLCDDLQLPSLSSATYYRNAGFLLRNMKLFAEELQAHVLAAVKVAYAQQDVTAAVGEPLNVDVSYDGTWMTRGHRSHIGAGFVIDCVTGFTLDFEIISNFCELCFKKEKSLSPADFTTWKATHRNCKKNFEGKAGSMETEAARRLWSRSVARGYRYTSFVGDGDSSAFNAVKELNPYPGVTVVKEECLNHVSKRLGSRLRNLKKNLKVPVTTKKGKIIQRSVLAGKHGLTDSNIDKLQLHYGQNVRAHPAGGSVEDLRKSIMATYYHARSNDVESYHADCSPSWCWVKKALEDGETPASHSTKNLYLSGLSPVLRKQVFLVYNDLTATPLLQRCLKKRTQNPNESLHSKLWVRCAKVKNSQLQRVQFAAMDTVMIHNFGRARGSLLGRLGLWREATKQRRSRSDANPSLATPTPRKRRRVEPSDEAAAGPSSAAVAGPSSGAVVDYGAGKF
jgi:hypothetical protein